MPAALVRATTSRYRRYTCALACLLAAPFLTRPASATELFWLPTSNSWDAANRWSTDFASYFPSSLPPSFQDIAYFDWDAGNNAVTVSVSNDGAAGLIFASTGGTTIANGNLTLFSGGSVYQISQFNGCPATISANLSLIGPQSWSANSTLNINGNVTGSGTINMSGNGTLALGCIYCSVPINVNSGTLTFNQTFALGSSPPISVANGATLDLAGNTVSYYGNLTVAGNGAGSGAIYNSSSFFAAAFYGSIIPNASATFSVGGAGDVNLLCPIANSTLQKLSANTLTLGGGSDNTNLTVTLNAGTLILAKSGGASVNAIGAGLLINGGTAQLAGSNQINDAAQLQIASNGIFDLNGCSDTVGPTVLNGGTITNSAAASSSTLYSPSGFTLTASSTINVPDAASTITLNGPVAFNTFGLTKAGSGALAISGPFSASSGSGQLLVTGGSILSSSNITLASIIINANCSFSQSNGSINAGAQLAIDGSYTLSNGSLQAGTELFSSSNTSVIFSQTAGTNSASSIIIGDAFSTSSSAVYNLSAGSLTAGSIQVGLPGSFDGAHLIVSGGNLTVTGSLSVDNTQHLLFPNLVLSGGNTTVGSLTPNGLLSWTGGNLTITSGDPLLNSTSFLGSSIPIAAGKSLFVNSAELTASPNTMVIQGGGAFSATRWINMDSTSYFLTNGTLTAPETGKFASIWANTTTVTFKQTGGSVFLGDLYTATNSGAFANITINDPSGAATFFANNLYLAGNNVSPSSSSLALLSLQSGTLYISNTLKLWPGGHLFFTGGILNVGNLDTSGNPSQFQWSAGAMTFTSNQLLIDPAGPLGGNFTLYPAMTLKTPHGIVISRNSAFSLSPDASIEIATLNNSGSFTNPGSLLVDTSIFNQGNFTQSGPQSWFPGSSFTNNGGSAIFRSNAKFYGLTITAGTVDITTSKFVINPANKSSTLAALRSNLANHSLISSTLPATFGLALIDNAITNFSTFGNDPADSNSLLLSAELLGDANADGTVNLADLATVLNNFGAATPYWTSGNFDYASTIDLTDLSYVLNNFGLTNPNANVQSVGATIAAPEPASLFALAAVAIPLVRRRRR